MDEHRPLRTFGRIKARTLKPRQAGLIDTLLPHLALPADGPIDLELLFSGLVASPPPCGEEREEGVTAPGPTDIGAYTPHPILPPQGGKESLYPVVLEIGFGGGEHLVAQAAAHPNQRFIGVEPFINGVASCLRHIEESGVQNVRLHQGDARDVIARLPDASITLCYLLFPDPWPKTRHHKRRLIQPAFLDELARVLKLGAEVRFATDWANYAAWTLQHFVRDARFAWAAERVEDWRTAWAGHVTTRYEVKKLGDCAPIWLRFARVAGA